MRTLLILASMLVMLASCATTGNITEAYYFSHGNKITMQDMRGETAYIFTYNVDDSTTKSNIHFDGMVFFSQIDSVSTDSTVIHTHFNGNRMVVKLRSKVEETNNPGRYTY